MKTFITGGLAASLRHWRERPRTRSKSMSSRKRLRLLLITFASFFLGASGIALAEVQNGETVGRGVITKKASAQGIVIQGGKIAKKPGDELKAKGIIVYDKQGK
jgi:hypothetical protein